jgi:hypothetical protein
VRVRETGLKAEVSQMKKFLQKIGHFQAQLFLTVLFVLLLTPYALLLRLFVRSFLPQGHWRDVENHETALDDLRHSF